MLQRADMEEVTAKNYKREVHKAQFRKWVSMSWY